MRKSYRVRGTTIISASASLTLTSEFNSQFSKDGAGFCDKQGGGAAGRGINIATIDPSNGAIEDCRNFDTYIDLQQFAALVTYIGTIPTGRIVVAAIADAGGCINPQSNCHTPRGDPKVEQGYFALEQLGSQQIRALGYQGSWALIAIKGQGVIDEASQDPVYGAPINGFCQLQTRRSAQATAVSALNDVSLVPWFEVFLPLLMR